MKTLQISPGVLFICYVLTYLTLVAAAPSNVVNMMIRRQRRSTAAVANGKGSSDIHKETDMQLLFREVYKIKLNTSCKAYQGAFLYNARTGYYGCQLRSPDDCMVACMMQGCNYWHISNTDDYMSTATVREKYCRCLPDRPHEPCYYHDASARQRALNL